MGIIPKPDDYSVGNCLACWPEGETPLLVKCFFAGIQRGNLWWDGLPAPPNGYWDLIHCGEDRCAFGNLWGPIERVGWSPTTELGDSWLRVDVGIPRFAFSGTEHNICARYFTNDYVNPFNNHYVGGWGFIATPAEMAKWIEMALPVTGPDPRMELFPMEDRQIVIRFANIQDGTNMKLRIDVDDL